jgi:hypothetical protein
VPPVGTIFTVELGGLKETLARLEGFDKKLRTEIIRASAREANKVIATAVRAGTYTTFNRTDGMIREGWGVRTALQIKNDRLLSYVVQDERPTAKMAEPAILSVKRRTTGRDTPENYRAFWTLFLERGTKERFNKKGASRGEIGQRSFVAPAFNATADAAIKTFSVVSYQLTEEALAGAFGPVNSSS